MVTALVLEWAAFLLRWLHVVAAIAWVGASFYFIWVENRLIRGGEQRHDKAGGHLWAIHGGGFYYLEKQRVAPVPLPPHLHWFKWEAYATWLSGMGLMTVLYYFNPAAWLAAAGTAPAVAVGCGVGYLAAGYAVYAGLARTGLLRRPVWFGAVGLGLVTLSTWGLLEVMTPRGTFLHVGAMLATIMVGNVAMVIIPVQRRMVAAAARGENPDMRDGAVAGLRSLHNNYLALPVVFLMISLHTPLLAGGGMAPVTLALMVLFAVCVRHVFNLRNKGVAGGRRFAVAAAVFLVLAMGSAAPRHVFFEGDEGGEERVTMGEVRGLMALHCVSCHAAAPTDEVFRVAPVGLLLETEAQVTAAREAIYRRVVVDRSMPFNNASNMTDDERAVIGRWFAESAEGGGE